MTTSLPLRLQLWQLTGETAPNGTVSPVPDHNISPTTSPIISPAIDAVAPCGAFDLIKSKSALNPSSTKSPPYPIHVESSTTSLSPPQPTIRRVLSLIDIPAHGSSLDNRNTHATVYTPPATTRALAPSPSWENLVSQHQQRVTDLRADQHRRRRRGITRAAYLYAGACYEGQQSVHHGGRELSWTVNVKILGLDMRRGVCCGMMEARDVPGQKAGSVTTFWEGQIVDNINHGFFTGRWDVTCVQDEMAWTRFVAFAPFRSLVEQQQPLIQQCYPCDGEQDGMTKPDQHTAERIYAKLQQLKRLAQQPPPRVECSDDTIFEISETIESVESAETTPETTPELSSESSAPECDTVSSDHTSTSTSASDDATEDECDDSHYDELACIAAHHRLTRKLNHSRYIFMRWKEMSFDENSATGLTIAGFYYVVMDRVDGCIIGIYQDQRACNQRLVLKHINPTSANGQSFSEYHFHN